MQEVDISTLLDGGNKLIKDIPKDIIIVGEINKFSIIDKYNQLDLSNIECNIIYYHNQEGEDIKNHILPNSLKELYCGFNKITSLPDLPNSLIVLFCDSNQLTSLPNLPNLLEKLQCTSNKLKSLPNLPNLLEILLCTNNKLTSIPNLPNSLKELSCDYNKLTSLPNLPKSLKGLYCVSNQLISPPDFSQIEHKLELNLYQDLPISYIPYNKNIYLNNSHMNKIIIEDYPNNPITSQDDLNKYMKYIKNYQKNRIKSARK